MVDVLGIDHVAIKAKDLSRSLAFYTQKLGFTEILRLNYADGSLFLIYLRITDTQYLELFPNGVGDRAPHRDAVAVNHFCLIVQDIDIAVRQLADANVPLARELKTGADGNRQAWIDDPDGNRIEIMELRQNSVQFDSVKLFHNGAGPVVIGTDVPPPASVSR